MKRQNTKKKHNLCPQYVGSTALILRGGARCSDDQPVSEERRKILKDFFLDCGDS